MAKGLNELLPLVLKRASAKRRALDDVCAVWRRAVGRALAAHPKPVSVRRGVLYVHTDLPGASFAVSLEKPRLLKQLQQTRGSHITDIVVRVGEPA